MLNKYSFCLLLAVAPALLAQEPVTPPPTPPAAAAAAVTPPVPAATIATMSPDQLRTKLTQDEAKLKDWPALGRYRDADAQLAPPAANEDRVVFMGDSITDNWAKDPATFFPGKPYIGRGIGGQTTPQMVVRFQQDVIALHPKAVIILAGTNDISGNTGVLTDEAIENDYKTMADLAVQNGIRVIFSSILPTCEARTASRPIERILGLNAWLQDYVKAHNFTYVDYYPAMLDDETNELRRSLTGDCLHPNADGFKIMAPLAEEGIRAALAQPQTVKPAHKTAKP